jgi:dihydroorotase
MKQLTIKNCTIVNEESLLEGDVLIKNGRIEKIEASIDEEGEFIDAKGLHLLPGFSEVNLIINEPR